jgi:hypothetical protein
MLRYFLPADFLLTLGDFCTGRLPAVLRGAVRCAPVRFRDALAFLVFDGFFLVMRLRLTTFLVFFATALTASPTALPAVIARPFAPSNPALAVSATAAPVLATAAFAVVSIPPLACFAICPPCQLRLIFAASTNEGNGQRRVFPWSLVKRSIPRSSRQ